MTLIRLGSPSAGYLDGMWVVLFVPVLVMVLALSMERVEAAFARPGAAHRREPGVDDGSARTGAQNR